MNQLSIVFPSESLTVTFQKSTVRMLGHEGLSYVVQNKMMLADCYIFSTLYIFCNMGIRRFFERNFFNLTLMIRQSKWHFVAAFSLLLLGFILGCILNDVAATTIWLENRHVFVVVVVRSGNFFSVLFSVLFHAVIYLLALFVLSLHFRLNYLKFLLIFLAGIYLGVYMCIALKLFGLLGFFYFLLIFLLGSLFVTVAIVLSFFDFELYCTSRRPFWSNIFNANVRAMVVLGIGCLVKIILIFAILRLFTAFI